MKPELQPLRRNCNPYLKAKICQENWHKNITKQSTQGISNEIRSIVLTLWLSEGCEKNTVTAQEAFANRAAETNSLKELEKKV